MSELVLRDEASGEEYALGPEVRIGRARHCEVRLDDPDCRAEHAAIAHFSSGYAVSTLDRKAMLSINGEPVSDSRQLQPGDCIEIGSTRLVLAIGEAFGPPVDAGAKRGEVPAPVAVAHSPEELLPGHAQRQAPVAFAPQQRRGRRRRRSAATRGWATVVCFVIVFADAIAVGWYLTGN